MIESKVYLDEGPHKYFHKDTGEEYISLSKLRSLIKEPFDSEKVSYFMAKKQLKELIGTGNPSELQIRSRARIIQKMWADGLKAAGAHGTRVHKALELFQKTGRIEDHNLELEIMIKKVSSLFSGYAFCAEEVTVYDEESRIAGTIDKPCFYQKKPGSIVDVYDYKTPAKGIKFNNPYGKYFFDPLGFLQDCSYVDYSLQLSDYGYMLEKTFGFKVGKLAIIYIPWEADQPEQIIPVPYMRNEIVSLHSWFRNQNYWAPKQKSSIRKVNGKIED